MFKRICFSVFVALLVSVLFSSFGEAAHLNVITDSPSWYYGQRGAGVLEEELIDGVRSESFRETRFGHLTLHGSGSYYIQSGDGENEIMGNWTDTSVGHSLSIAYGDYGNNKNHVDIRQTASASGSVWAGPYSTMTHVLIADDGFGTWGAYADSTVVQAMQIEADNGESVGNPVTVTVSSRYWWYADLSSIDPIPMGWIQGIISGPAGTSGFTVFRKDSNGNILETYAHDPVTLYENASSPRVGIPLWDLTIDATVGDIIEVDSAIFSKIYLDGEREDGSEFDWQGYASLELHTGVDVASSPVPIPAAIWLLGSGLLGLVAIRRSDKA